MSSMVAFFLDVLPNRQYLKALDMQTKAVRMSLYRMLALVPIAQNNNFYIMEPCSLKTAAFVY